ncbi:MAG: translation elongation factor Ts [Luteitalea sp.]|nr:translation elongation factor Ts [Luteitalea sp.]
MTVTAEQVKSLRARTGAGMMECKNALVQAGGNADEAVEVLRKRGLAQAAKRAGRATGEGLIGLSLSDDRTRGTMVEVNCETDFVARTDDFRALVKEITRVVAEADANADAATLTGPETPIGVRLSEAVAKVGENMAVSRIARLTGDFVARYIHFEKIGVLVAFAGVDASTATSEGFTTFANEIAMQVAATSPLHVSREDVPAATIEGEKAIYRAQLESASKPPAVLDRIIEGKLGSFYEQSVLLEQLSIRPEKSKLKVADLVAEAASTTGRPLRILTFARFKVGEA